MSTRSRAIVLVVVQCLLVSSIAAKHLYERATCPRVWTRTAQYDPELPMRGRYLALSPEVDACAVERNAQPATSFSPTTHIYRVRFAARDGKLVVESASRELPRSAFQSVTIGERTSCEHALILPAIDYFVPDSARSPFPLKPGQELWVEVTVPPSGSPRAIQLALSESGNWKVLKFD